MRTVHMVAHMSRDDDSPPADTQPASLANFGIGADPAADYAAGTPTPATDPYDHQPHVRVRGRAHVRRHPERGNRRMHTGWWGYCPERDAGVYCRKPASIADDDHLRELSAWGVSVSLLDKMADRGHEYVLVPETSTQTLYEYHRDDFRRLEATYRGTRQKDADDPQRHAPFAAARTWDAAPSDVFIPQSTREYELRREAPTIYDGPTGVVAYE